MSTTYNDVDIVRGLGGLVSAINRVADAINTRTRVEAVLGIASNSRTGDNRRLCADDLDKILSQIR